MDGSEAMNGAKMLYVVPDGREGLGKVVRDVAKAFDVSHGELQLGNPVLNPIKAHVAGFG